LAAVYPGLFKRLVKEPACWSDKRLALKIFIIPRLLADEQNFSVSLAVAEYRLSGIFP
jgi:hypothetical protein